MKPYYEQDGISLYLGDCREVVPALDQRFDAVIADPPYNQTNLEWDRWPEGWLHSVWAVSRSLWCFGSFRLFWERQRAFRDANWRFSQDVIWEKHNGSSFHADRFRRVHELACHFYHGDWDSLYKRVPTTNDATARVVRRKDRPAHMGEIEGTTYTSVDGGPRLMRSVMFAPSTHGHAENETQKPETIVAPLIEYTCQKGGVILAPFAGSGIDLVVAKALGRKAVGCEVRESQCEKAAKRLQAMLPMEVA